jgi:hypothetical protein
MDDKRKSPSEIISRLKKENGLERNPRDEFKEELLSFLNKFGVKVDRELEPWFKEICGEFLDSKMAMLQTIDTSPSKVKFPKITEKMLVDITNFLELSPWPFSPSLETMFRAEVEVALAANRGETEIPDETIEDLKSFLEVLPEDSLELSRRNYLDNFGQAIKLMEDKRSVGHLDQYGTHITEKIKNFQNHNGRLVNINGLENLVFKTWGPIKEKILSSKKREGPLEYKNAYNGISELIDLVFERRYGFKPEVSFETIKKWTNKEN